MVITAGNHGVDGIDRCGVHVAHGVVVVVARPEQVVGAGIGVAALHDADGAGAFGPGVAGRRAAEWWGPAAVAAVGGVVGCVIYDAAVGENSVRAEGEWCPEFLTSAGISGMGLGTFILRCCGRIGCFGRVGAGWYDVGDFSSAILQRACGNTERC